MSDSLKIWFLSSEAIPFAKTGGLADVAGSLPIALKKMGVEVGIALPYYRIIKEGGHPVKKVLKNLEVPLGRDSLQCDVLEARTREDIPVFLFDREDLYDRPNLYRTPQGDYYDNLGRFAYFCSAALVFARIARLHFDLIHCHDWQTGLVPAYLKTLYQGDPFFAQTSTLFTIHNIGYQGVFPKENLIASGIPPSEYHLEGIEYWGGISLLKAGIVYADALTTVSPKYSLEIQTPAFGMGMEGILKKRSDRIHGVLNGADYGIWNPVSDPYIPSHYSFRHPQGKRENKSALLSELKLHPSLQKRPLLAMVSRLSTQKGCDLLLQILEEIPGCDTGLVILGEGDERYETSLHEAAARHSGNIAVRIGFDDSLAHRIIAGADILLVPSLYEPCGLTQIYALKYGTIPVVRATGGLDDTVIAFDPEGSREGNGFKFIPYEAQAFLETIKQAIACFENTSVWKTLMANAMKADFSWEHSAGRYLEIYHFLKKRSRTANDVKVGEQNQG